MLVREGNKIIVRKRSNEFLDFLKSDKGKIESWWKDIKKKCKSVDDGDCVYYEINPDDYKKVAGLFFDCLKTSKKVYRDAKITDYSPSLDRVIRKLENDKDNADTYDDKAPNFKTWLGSKGKKPYSCMYIRDDVASKKSVKLLYVLYGEDSPHTLGSMELQ